MTDDADGVLRLARAGHCLWAAIDLGSNSFRLEIAREKNDHFERLQYLKETVRLGGGLDAETGDLSEAAMQRGWQCLAAFGQRLRKLPGMHTRAVATQTLREAGNAGVFLQRAQKLLGLPIAVISARLNPQATCKAASTKANRPTSSASNIRPRPEVTSRRRRESDVAGAAGVSHESGAVMVCSFFDSTTRFHPKGLLLPNL